MVTAFVDNAVGRLLEDLSLQGEVNMDTGSIFAALSATTPPLRAVRIYASRPCPGLEIMDRVGGDSFASGLIYGLLTTGDPPQAVDYGAEHGALTMTTPGDTSMATLGEVKKLMAYGSARVVR